MAVSIHAVRGFFGRLAFLRAAAALRSEPQFTPDLSLDFLHTTSPKNPFFKTAETEFFVAKRGGHVVGRVSATVDRRHEQRFGERVVCFGHFEVDINDADATRELLGAAAAFGRARGATHLRGPIDMSTNYRVGLLIDAFGSPPSVMMPWNPPEYAARLEAEGLVKLKDLVAMEVDDRTIDTERYERLAQRAMQRGGYTIRCIDMKRFKSELLLFQKVYNESWAENWGFLPMPEDELLFVASGMKEILRPELVLVAERRGELAGFALVVPDIAVAVREIHGKLFPFGIVKFLKRIKSIDRLRVLTLGVLPEHRGSGLDSAMYAEITKRGLKLGIRYAEFGWMLEDNMKILSPLLASGAKVTKRYRIYQRAV